MSTQYLKVPRSRRVPPPPLTPIITGTVDAWEDRTPYGLITDQLADFGWLSLVGDPLVPSRWYASLAVQGLFQSDDYGRTWIKVPVTGNDPIANCRATVAIAPDGSYLATNTFNIDTSGGLQVGIYVSLRDGNGLLGRSGWTRYTTACTGDDVGTLHVNPFDANNLVLCGHTGFNFVESYDKGQTSFDKGVIVDSNGSHFGRPLFLDANTVLIMSDGDDDAASTHGIAKGTRSGGMNSSCTWSWALVDNMKHFHGDHLGYRHPATGDILMAGGLGVRRSTNNGLSFTSVSSTPGSHVVATATRFHALRSYASQGTSAVSWQTAEINDPTTWTDRATPGGTYPDRMFNGPNALHAIADGRGGWGILSADWCAGLWGYLESVGT